MRMHETQVLVLWAMVLTAGFCFVAGWAVAKESYWRGRQDQMIGRAPMGWMAKE